MAQPNPHQDNRHLPCLPGVLLLVVRSFHPHHLKGCRFCLLWGVGAVSVAIRSGNEVSAVVRGACLDMAPGEAADRWLAMGKR